MHWTQIFGSVVASCSAHAARFFVVKREVVPVFDFLAAADTENLLMIAPVFSA
jgi:hypothetical protein